MIATLMQALDSTIANVALPYMQGSLSASYDQITWVLTAYIAAVAIMAAPVGWLAARFGRKRLLIFCVAGFTIVSMLCGIATSLPQIVLDRIAQGAFGAALVPLSQSTMLDIYPVERRGNAMAIWGMGVMVGPIMGPPLGGYLTSMYDWRYVFFVNLPFGILAIAGLLFCMPKDEPAQEMRFDWTGFLVLSLGIGALQIGLDRGEELDWLSSPFIVTCAILSVVGLYLFLVHMFTAPNPFIPRAIFKDRTFNVSMVASFSIGLTLLAASALMAPYLETLNNYPVLNAGFLMSPRGIGTMLAMLVAGRVLRTTGPRPLIIAGNIVMLLSFWSMTRWTPDISPQIIVTTTFAQGAGIGLIFTSLQVVTFETLPAVFRTQASSLIYLIRNVGSAIGVSLTSAVLDHTAQAEHSVLTGYITPFARPLQAGGAVTHFLNPSTPGGATILKSMIDTQSQIIAYANDYKFLLIISVPAALSVFLMRKPQPNTQIAPADLAELAAD